MAVNASRILFAVFMVAAVRGAHEERSKIERTSADTQIPKLPAFYEVGSGLSQFGIPFNGSGWDSYSGHVKAAITLFVEDMEYLDLYIDGGVEWEQISLVRVRVSHEKLRISETRKVGDINLIRFAVPEGGRFGGVQVLFIAFADSKNFERTGSAIKLLKVKWR